MQTHIRTTQSRLVPHHHWKRILEPQPTVDQWAVHVLKHFVLAIWYDCEDSVSCVYCVCCVIDARRVAACVHCLLRNPPSFLSISLCSNTGEYQECYKLPSPSPQERSNQYCYFRDGSSTQKNPSILIVDACNHTRATVIDTSVHSIHLQIQFWWDDLKIWNNLASSTRMHEDMIKKKMLDRTNNIQPMHAVSCYRVKLPVMIKDRSPCLWYLPEYTAPISGHKV